MIVNKKISEAYRGISPEIRAGIREKRAAFRRAYNEVAAHLLFRGYVLGVMTGLGDTETDRKIYGEMIDRTVPQYVRPYFERLVLERLPPLVEQMQGSVRAGIELERKRRAKKKRAVALHLSGGEK
jgi:hypothetical protein